MTIDTSNLSRFNILVVCTGNICRSPLAEWILADRFSMVGSVVVSSAGTGAISGCVVPDEILKIASARGLDRTVAHLARQVTAELVAQSDLVLTATREHRAAVARLHPKSTAYCFTMNQFARLIRESNIPASFSSMGPVAALTEVVAEVARNRGAVLPPANANDDDVNDPFRQSVEVYELVSLQIHEAIAEIAMGLGRVFRARRTVD